MKPLALVFKYHERGATHAKAVKGVHRSGRRIGALICDCKLLWHCFLTLALLEVRLWWADKALEGYRISRLFWSEVQKRKIPFELLFGLSSICHYPRALPVCINNVSSCVSMPAYIFTSLLGWFKTNPAIASHYSSSSIPTYFKRDQESQLRPWQSATSPFLFATHQYNFEASTSPIPSRQ